PHTPTACAAALTLFVLAAISDYLDGVLARAYQTSSRIGQFLDPFADKVLVLGTFITLSFMRPDLVPWWAVALIALRDVGVTVLRSWAEANGRSIRTLPVAKLKTTLQLVFLIGVLAMLTLTKVSGWPQSVGIWVLDSIIPFLILMALVVLTAGTGVLYMFRLEYTRPADAEGGPAEA
ncbi:MAG: CDP-alcohol phosphatidyltransferase family protein, partial [Bacteroidota bacterium]